MEELPFAAAFGVYGSWVGLIICIAALAAICYVSLVPVYAYPGTDDYYISQHPPFNQYTFWSNYLAAAVIFFTFSIYLIYKKLTDPEMGWGLIWLDDINLEAGRADIPSLEVLRAEREDAKQQPLYQKAVNFFF